MNMVAAYQTVEERLLGCRILKTMPRKTLTPTLSATSYNDLFLGGGAAYTCLLYDKDGNCKKWSKDPIPFDSMVGLRFRNVAVPPKAVITNAYITFKAYTNGSGNASITIRGEDAGSPDVYSATNERYFRQGPTSVR